MTLIIWRVYEHTFTTGDRDAGYPMEVAVHMPGFTTQALAQQEADDRNIGHHPVGTTSGSRALPFFVKAEKVLDAAGYQEILIERAEKQAQSLRDTYAREQARARKAQDAQRAADARVAALRQAQP